MPTFQHLFNIPALEAPLASSGQQQRQAPEATKVHGVFNSIQAVVMFPGASGLITIVWKVLEKVFPSWGGDVTIPFGLALLVGISLYLVSGSQGKTRTEKAVGFFFALLNSCALAAAALGIDSATKSTPPGH